jgi:hypothetical protein
VFRDFSFDQVANDFDRYAGDRSFGANLARAGLSWNDARSMHQREKQSRDRLWIPAWTASDKLLRAVIEAKIQHHIEHMTWRAPSQPYQLGIILRHQAAISRAGGYPQLVAAIAYRSFRLGWTSPVIAESLGVTPTMVRQLIYRLRQTARRIGVEQDEPRQPSAGVRLRGKRLRALRARLAGNKTARVS